MLYIYYSLDLLKNQTADYFLFE